MSQTIDIWRTLPPKMRTGDLCPECRRVATHVHYAVDANGKATSTGYCGTHARANGYVKSGQPSRQVVHKLIFEEYAAGAGA